MSEVMDIMLKIGVTEEVTHAFAGISHARAIELQSS